MQVSGLQATFRNRNLEADSKLEYEALNGMSC